MSWLLGFKQKRKKVETPTAKPIPKKPSLLDCYDEYHEEIELLHDSRLFGPEDPKKISENLPARIYGNKWKLIYSSFKHGISSSTLIRSSRDHGGPNLLIIKDDMGYVFGAFSSHAWYNAEPKFYGNGECFLFQLHPMFQVYKWTSKNNYCQMIENNRLIMGGGQGIFGLWIDEDLLSGSTQPCETFDNEVIASASYFKIFGLELWGFDDN